MIHTLKPSTEEAELDRSPSSNHSLVPGQLGLHRKAQFQKNKTKENFSP